MPQNKVAENVLGTAGTICWSVQLIPQLWKSWRTKSVDGLSPMLMLLWGIAGIPLGVYSVVQDLNIPLIIQPQLFGFLALFSWIQCQYYGNNKSKRWCALVFGIILVLFSAIEVGCVLAIKPRFERGEPSALKGATFFGVISSVLVALGLLPQYFEIYKHRAVFGISITFMLVDMAGGVLSDLSLVFSEEFNVLASITYTLVVVMDGVVVVAAAILNPRARRRARAEMDRDAESQTEVAAQASIEASTVPVQESVVVAESKHDDEATKCQ